LAGWAGFPLGEKPFAVLCFIIYNQTMKRRANEGRQQYNFRLKIAVVDRVKALAPNLSHLIEMLLVQWIENPVPIPDPLPEAGLTAGRLATIAGVPHAAAKTFLQRKGVDKYKNEEAAMERHLPEVKKGIDPQMSKGVRVEKTIKGLAKAAGVAYMTAQAFFWRKEFPCEDAD
jgi:hypothetical protein